MKDALDVHRRLLAREVPHEIVRLPRFVLSADEIPTVLGLPAERVVVARLYDVDDQLTAVLVRAGEQPHPGAVLAALRARSMRAAAPSLVNAATDFAAGLVSPVLLPAAMPVLADSCVGHSDVVYTATGDGGTALGIPTRHLLVQSRAATTELCAPVPLHTEYDDELDLLDDLTPRQSDWR
jgi:prolyl-tRNA editing enzyme YbaK/EbsC (Cys-tRNA(Pro) deacylase)